MAEFAQPLIDAAAGDLESINRAMTIGMLCWNMAICKDDERREEILIGVMNKAVKTEQDQAEFRKLVDTMIERHHQMFPEMHRGNV